MIVLRSGISSKKNQPKKEAHNNIEYSNGDTTAGEAIRYAVNKSKKAAEAVKPTIIIYKIELSKLINHSRKINCDAG